ncbi:MAG: hypothetical protein ACQEXG_07540 [Pseudomonadota bacterium]
MQVSFLSPSDVAATGHLGSADTRSAMHAKALADFGRPLRNALRFEAVTLAIVEIPSL